MRDKLRLNLAAALVAPLAIMAGERAAHATNCSDLPQPVYITGSTAAQAFLAPLGTALTTATPAVTIVYKGQGSCVGVDAAINGTPITGTANYWDNTGTLQTCNLVTPAGNVVTLGVSDIFATTCPGVTSLPATVGDFFGPNQVMEMVVPTVTGHATSISAEGAYFVFGFGQAGMAAPWSDDTNIFMRGPNSGTEQMIAHAINVPAASWKGVLESSSGLLLAALNGSTNKPAAIGILVAGDADSNRATLSTLAFQDYKKTCAFWPDSSSTSFDKISVRNGDYPIWGPMHFLAKVDNTNTPTDPLAKQVIGYFTGKVTPPATVNLLDLEIKAHTVPSCAMAVQRSTELGALTPYTPAEPCNCYYDKGEDGTTTCSVCTTDTDCTKPGANHCRHGYCEAN